MARLGDLFNVRKSSLLNMLRDIQKILKNLSQKYPKGVSSKERGGLEPIMNPREAVRANYESLIR